VKNLGVYGLTLIGLLASCGQQAVPNGDDIQSSSQERGVTSEVRIPVIIDGLSSQANTFSLCYFTIDNAHNSSTVGGNVKVNATGTCPPSEPYNLETSMVLEKCDGQFGTCYAYKTGITKIKLVGAQGAKWYNADLNSFTPCVVSGWYRGRINIRVTKTDGVVLGSGQVVPPTGNIRYVACS
jgi:hypothetical protein